MGLLDMIVPLASLSMTSWIMLLCLLLLTTWYMSTNPWLNLPPGPPVLPVLGSVPFLGSKNFKKALLKLSKKYGDLYCLNLGATRTVVLCGYDTIKEALVKNGTVFSGRPYDFIAQEFANRKGITTNLGESFQVQRRFMLHVLKDFGLGKSTMDDLIMDEATHLMEEFQKHVNQNYDPQLTLKKAASNLVNVLAFGERRDYDDPKYIKSMRLVIDIFQAMGGGSVLALFPFLRFLPGDFFGFQQYRANLKELKAQYQEMIDKHKAMLLEGQEPTDLIGRYLVEINKGDRQQTHYTEDHLLHIIGDLFLAATDTSSSTLYWIILYMVVYPDIQDKVYKEISDVVGPERSPSAQDRSKLHYTEAVVAETMRRSSVAPLTLPHAPTEDIILKGYLIPKGTMILPLTYSIDMDPNIWENPDEFMPERHLDKHGVFKKRDEQIPFSLGKRSCPGEGLARKEMFFFFTNMIQKYHIRLPDGATTPSTEGPGEGAIYNPYPYHIVFENR